MRCDGAAAGRQCPHDATHGANVGATAGPVLGCPEHVAAHPELPWQPLAEEPPVLKLARVAAAALTQALATERDAAAEVEADHTIGHAGLILDTDRQSAAVALGELAKLLPAGRSRNMVVKMADGAARGYARPEWALRVVALASEVGRG